MSVYQYHINVKNYNHTIFDRNNFFSNKLTSSDVCFSFLILFFSAVLNNYQQRTCASFYFIIPALQNSLSGSDNKVKQIK